MSYLVSTPHEQESTYPYKAVDQSCSYHGKGVVNLSGSGYVSVKANSPSQMQAYVAANPITVLVEADQAAF